MTELELYKFCQEKEMGWRGEELVIWIYFRDLDEFVELIGDGYFAEGGIESQLQYIQVAFDLVPICEHFDIDPTNIFPKD